MREFFFIAKKELLSLIRNPAGFIFAGLLLIVSNWIFMADFFVNGMADIKPYWTTMLYLLSIFVPTIAMGALADEKKYGNWEVIISWPINELQVVVGKLLGLGIYFAGVMSLTVSIVATLVVLGHPDSSTLISGIVGMILAGLAYLSLAIFLSSTTNQAIVAFLLTTVALIINNLMGQNMIVSRIPTWLGEIISYLSLTPKVLNFLNGVIRIDDLVFISSWVVVFVIASVIVLKSRDK